MQSNIIYPVIIILFSLVAFVSCTCRCKIPDKGEHGPVFPPPGAPTKKPCVPAFHRLEKVMDRIRHSQHRVKGIFNTFIQLGPWQLTVKETKWAKGWDQIKVNNDSHFFCSPDSFLEKYAIQVNVELPPGQVIEGDIGIWAWGANHENKFWLTSTRPIIISLKWQYDDAGGWSVTQATDMGPERGGFEMELNDCSDGGPCDTPIVIMEEEISKVGFEGFKKLSEAVFNMIKEEDQR
jgi:hypothetical protein